MVPVSQTVFSVLSMLGFVAVLIPLPWHLQAWNTGTCLYIFWSAVGCLNWFINSILFRGTAVDAHPVWCDFSSRVVIALNVAIQASGLCIMRRLYHISSVQSATITKAEKRRLVVNDLCVGLGIPLVQVIIFWFIQGHRYDILEDLGCFPYIFNSWLGYVLCWSWSIVLGLISAVYGVLTIRAFLIRRTRFKELLSASTQITVDRYWRLMALATLDLVCTVPFSTWILITNVLLGLDPYKGLADEHKDIGLVSQVPRILWTSDPIAHASCEATRWACVASAWFFFAFFGFADEARKHYRIAICSVAKRMGVSTSFMGSSGFSSTGGAKAQTSFGNGIPSFVRPQLPTKTFMEPKLREKSSIDSMFDQYSARLSIGSVYDVQLKKDKDETEIVRLATPDSISSRRASIQLELESGLPEDALPTLSEQVLDISAPRHGPNDNNV